MPDATRGAANLVVPEGGGEGGGGGREQARAPRPTGESASPGAISAVRASWPSAAAR